MTRYLKDYKDFEEYELTNVRLANIAQKRHENLLIQRKKHKEMQDFFSFVNNLLQTCET